MKRVFIDTNVFIDYIGQRGQFYEPAAKIVSLADIVPLARIFAVIRNR